MKVFWTKIATLLFVFHLLIGTLQGQLDTEHWIPAMYSGNDQGEAGFLYISTPESAPFPVTVSYRQHFSITNPFSSFDKYIDTTVMVSNAKPVVLNPYYIFTNMTVFYSELNTVLKERGFFLKGAKKFYASYRVYSKAHAGCLTAKGKAALGTVFRAGHLIAGKGNHTIGMMATENNTQVTLSNFRPGTYLMSSTGPKLANAPISFTLNKGECYVIAMEDANYQNNFTNGFFGLLITATKPIAVNCGSWLGFTGKSASRDIGIDQITPLEYAGTEYILMAGEGPSSIENGMVVGHYDNTEVYINGSNTPIILDAGEYLTLYHSNYFNSQNVWQGNMYIKTDKKVFVYQNLGGGSGAQTAALNFIPPTNCQIGNSVDNIPSVDYIGSKQFVGEIQVVASSSAPPVIIKRNGQSVPLGAPIPVQGNPDYVIYRTNLDGTISVSSEGPVQVAVAGKSGDAGQGGYYSGFRKEFIPEVSIMPNQLCPDTLFLTKEDVNWGVRWYLDGQLINTVNESIVKITQPGAYMAIGAYRTYCGEILYDTAYYTVADNFVNIETDVTPVNCFQGQSAGRIMVNAAGNGPLTYSLNNGPYGNMASFPITAPGAYTVSVRNQQGCVFSRQVQVPDNPIYFYNPTLCPGESVIVNGTLYDLAKPMGIEYFNQSGKCDSIVQVNLEFLPEAVNNLQQQLCSGECITVGNQTFCETNPSGTVVLQTVNGCDSTVHVQLSFAPNVSTQLFQTSCHWADTGIVVRKLKTWQGCDSIVTTVTSYKEPLKFSYTAQTCDPQQDGTKTFTYDCDSVVTITTVFKPELIPVGYEIQRTCQMDLVGIDTITYQAVSVDCDSLHLVQTIFDATLIPVLTLNAEPAPCPGEPGNLLAEVPIGGTAPFVYSINNGNPQADGYFDNLSPGVYSVLVTDKEGCTAIGEAKIAPAPELTLSLGQDTIIKKGDTIVLESVLHPASLMENFTWQPAKWLLCPTCLSTTAAPLTDITYTLEVSYNNGCTVTATKHIQVIPPRQLYLPNAIYPGSATNGYLTVFGDEDVLEVEMLQVYDRWGGLIFENKNFHANIPVAGWNGTWKGKDVTPGLYVAFARVRFRDGQREDLKGDVMVVR